MSTDANQELQSFQQFIVQQLNSGDASLSPEEALDAWRMEHPTLEQFREDVEAIRQALADMEAGDTGIPADEYLADFRKRHNLDCDP